MFCSLSKDEHVTLWFGYYHQINFYFTFFNLWTSSFFAISDTMRSFFVSATPTIWFWSLGDFADVFVYALKMWMWLGHYCQNTFYHVLYSDWLESWVSLSYFNFQRANINDAGQTEQMHRLVCCFHATRPGFLTSRPIFYICTYVLYTSRKALARLRKCTHSSELRLLAYAIKTNADIVSKSIKCTE